ncbi:CHAT domain-containing protein [Streptomyces sp. ODS28]|uniref:CHAT domain-containing protein n=1 Tax=Streptomyces sp. ODS28 TaxID=3136688 RepID=UPI0031F05FF3
MSEISLMVMPQRADDEDSGPLFLLLRNGVWRSIPWTGHITMAELREGTDHLLGDVMDEIEADRPEGALSNLQGHFSELWNHLIPLRLQIHIREALEGGGTPRLLVHTHRQLDWIPWELLYPEGGWLGVRCRIARLPIVDRGGPEELEPEHPVRRVASFLGGRIFEEPLEQGAEYKGWYGLFDGLCGVRIDRWPVGARAGPPELKWPTVEDFRASCSADIIHMTCHSGVRANAKPYLTLNGTELLAHAVTGEVVGAMKYPPQGPLIFGNACGRVPGAERRSAVIESLATSFYKQGVSAYIGTMASISRRVALSFAQHFYGRLLVEHEPVGEALRRTKEHFAESKEPDPSWLFYCLYGWPDTRFVRAADNGDAAAEAARADAAARAAEAAVQAPEAAQAPEMAVGGGPE